MPGLPTGAPHFGQDAADVDILFPHSGHFTKAMFPRFPSNARVERRGASSAPLAPTNCYALLPRLQRLDQWKRKRALHGNE